MWCYKVCDVCDVAPAMVDMMPVTGTFAGSAATAASDLAGFVAHTMFLYVATDVRIPPLCM